MILGVGQLLTGLSGLMEAKVGRVWIVGEISNFHRAGSGHCYFTLKDDGGQIRAALFRGNASRVRFELEEGLEVVAEADVSIYAARGDLQLIVRGLEPRGVGTLQLAFEQLRRRLAAAGFFDADRKRQIPTHPHRIGVVASPTSAAIRDVLKVAGRRFPGIPLLISPTLVQGDEAPAQVASAIARLAGVADVDVVLVVRGGGSIEDLWAFNTEVVARAIHDSPVPIITGVGHETDTTIADLVADLRAPTPSAAAMLALPDAEAIGHVVSRDVRRLVVAMRRRIDQQQQRIGRLAEILRARSPQARIALARTREARARTAATTAIRDRLTAGRRVLSETGCSSRRAEPASGSRSRVRDRTPSTGWSNSENDPRCLARRSARSAAGGRADRGRGVASRFGRGRGLKRRRGAWIAKKPMPFRIVRRLAEIDSGTQRR